MEPELESLMLGVNECFPNPDREDNVVPALELSVMILVFNFGFKLFECVCFAHLRLVIAKKLLVSLVDASFSLDTLFLCEGVLDLPEAIEVVLERAHEHLETLFRDAVMGNVKGFNRLEARQSLTD